MKKATLADVAQKAGVSKGTASKALNGRPDVGTETRKKVEAAALELSFFPNSLARGLSGGRTSTVGIITSDLDGRFVLPILMGAEDALDAGQVSVLLCDARGDAIREHQHLKALLARRIDGIIVVGDSNDARPSLGRDIPVPIVYAYAPSADPLDYSITPNNYQIGKLATEHILGYGRQNLVHISGELNHSAAIDRAQGFDDTLQEAKLTPAASTLFGDWSAAWGKAAATTVLSTNCRVDGIVCGSDRIGMGVLQALADLKIRVPQDVSVIGIDNWNPLVGDLSPRLSSVDMGLEAIGRTAAKAIFETLDGNPSHQGIVSSPARVVLRESSMPCPSRNM